MTIYGLQFDILWEDPERNGARVLEILEAAPPQRDGLLVLPELFSTGFSMNLPVVTQTASATETLCAEIAARFGITVVAGIGTCSVGNRALNQAVAFAPNGDVLARYSKLHPFSYGRETEFYDAGEQIVTFSWNGLRVAPFVCYDLRFPEIFREARADIYCVGANWPAARAEHWNILLRARAIENQAYVIGVNRCGADPHLGYAGGSLLVGPRGEILADAGSEEKLISAQVVPDDLHEYRAHFPALKDRRD
jgi:predicted amidohydrolase